MPMVRTVFQPDTLQEMDEQEAAQLAAAGLLVDPKEWDGPPSTAPAVAPSAAPAPAPAPTVVVPGASKEVVPGGGK